MPSSPYNCPCIDPGIVIFHVLNALKSLQLSLHRPCISHCCFFFPVLFSPVLRCAGPIPCLDEQSGWFGEGCRYKCNCKDPNEDCNRFDGTCTECADNMFGPGCQYSKCSLYPKLIHIKKAKSSMCYHYGISNFC